MPKKTGIYFPEKYGFFPTTEWGTMNSDVIFRFPRLPIIVKVPIFPQLFLEPPRVGFERRYNLGVNDGIQGGELNKSLATVGQ